MMLLYTVKYRELVFDVIANNFDEVLAELSNELQVKLYEREVVIRAVVKFQKVTLTRYPG